MFAFQNKRRTFILLLVVVGIILFLTVENGLIGSLVVMCGIGLFVSDLIGPPEDGKHKKHIKH